MSKIDGNYFLVRVGGVTLGCGTTVSTTFDKDFQEVTNQDSGGNIEYEDTTGKFGMTGSFDGFYDPDNVLNAEELMDTLINNSGLSTIQVGQATTGVYWQCTGGFKGLEIAGKNDAVPTIKGSFFSSGAVTKQSAITGNLTAAETYDSHVLTLTYDVNMANVYGLEDQFSLTIDGTPATVTEIANDFDNTMFLTVTETMQAGDVLLLSILSGEVETALGGLLNPVTDFAVTNNL